jgi:hypothetical protein
MGFADGSYFLNPKAVFIFYVVNGDHFILIALIIRRLYVKQKLNDMKEADGDFVMPHSLLLKMELHNCQQYLTAMWLLKSIFKLAECSADLERLHWLILKSF